MRKHSLLQVVFGRTPPTNDVMVIPSRSEQWHGFDAHIFNADLPGYHIGEEIRKTDFSEIHSDACWLHLRDSDTLRAFGMLRVEAADKFDIHERRNGNEG